tara:strand:- start:1368 stop:1601 length:234 start_codon:yes stop_codon:yes gene_type:complete
MPRKSKRRKTISHTFDPHVMKEIEEQMTQREEIENRRKKRKIIFWSIVLFSTLAVTAGIIALLFFTGKLMLGTWWII